MADTGTRRIQFCCLVIASVHATSTAGTVISCQITPADDSEYENLTCIFAVNVGRLGKSFALFQDFGNTTIERKVSCNFFNGQPHCEVTDGFQAPETVTDRAVMLVPKTRNATFICETIPPEEGVKSCVLDVGTPQATQPPIGSNGNTGWRGWHAGVVVAVLTATVVISAVVCLIRRKRSRGRASEPKQKDKTDNEESAETENLNQPGQDAKLETSAAITSADASGEVGGSPDWCECGLCRQMPEEHERFCCRMNPCLSTSQKFKDNVLDRAKRWNPKKHDILHNDVNETKRKQAYTWFTEWKHGHLPKGVKIPVYSCCVWAVRDLMPDNNGKYTGFVQGTMICFKTEDFNARWGKQKT